MEHGEKDDINQRNNVTIQVDKILDCSAHHIFIQACRQADHPDIRALVVDLSATRGIRASGVGILLMLSELEKTSSYRVRIVNCQPQIRRQLHSSRLLAGLQIS